MATDTLEDLRARVMLLPSSERAELAHSLMESLDAPLDDDAADAWDKEIRRRLDQIDAGTAQLIDREEFRRRMRTRLTR